MTRRFETKGRKDPWRTHKPYRPTAYVEPMDKPRKDSWVRRAIKHWRKRCTK